MKKAKEGERDEKVEYAERMFDYHRVRIGIALRVLGSLYTSLGEILSESGDPQLVITTSEHIKTLLKDGRTVAYKGVLEDDIEELRRNAIEALERIEDQITEERKSKDGKAG